MMSVPLKTQDDRVADYKNSLSQEFSARFIQMIVPCFQQNLT